LNAVRASLWISLADSYLGLALRLVGTAVISRLLTPKEVGVLAVAAVFSNLASMFRDFGVAEYMIQEKDLSRQKIASTFALNILISWLMALAMYFCSGLVASFYGDAGIGQVMRVQAACFVLVPFGAVTMAYFRRELNFRPVFICNILGNIVGFISSISLAFLGFSYMSLAWASLASIIVTVLGSMWYRPKDFPRWPSFKAVGEVFHFSKFASSMYLFGQIGRGAPEMIIGRTEGMAEVAMFSRGNGLIEMFQRLALRPVLFVCMPYFARSDRKAGEISQAYIKSVMYLTGVGWPFLAFMGVAAYSAIRIIYGPQWDAAVPIAQILAAAFALELVHAMSREAILARGDAKAANNLQIWIVVLQVLGLLPVLAFGIVGAAWGTLVASGLGLVVSQMYLRRCFGLRSSEVLGACLPSLLLTAAATGPAAVWALWAGVGTHNYITFGLAAGALTVISWLVALKVLGHPLWEEVAGTAQRLSARMRRRG
jgi:O-antigen/teichoic acid export membrane protein